MPNLVLERKTKMSAFRRMAIGTWKTAYDPSVYGAMTLRVDEALRYIEEFRAKTGRRLTLSHLVAKVVGVVLKEHPDANAVLRFNRIYLRKEIRVFFQVVLKDPETGEIDLSGVTVDEPQDKSLLEIIDAFEGDVGKVRKGEAESEASRSLFKKIPSLLLNLFLNTLGFLLVGLNLDLRFAGIPKDPFGSVMVTNIGSLGLQEAYVPLVPYSRVPLLIALGTVTDVPVVEDGKVVPGKTMELCATFDHRVLDGAHAAAMARIVRAWIEDPYGHFESPDEAAASLEASAPDEGTTGTAEEARTAG